MLHRLTPEKAVTRAAKLSGIFTTLQSLSTTANPEEFFNTGNLPNNVPPRVVNLLP